MAWLVIAGVVALLWGAVLVDRRGRRARARRGWRAWDRERRSGALAWWLFTRRAKVPRLEDRTRRD